MVCSYLSPAAIGPLGTWARFTGPLLIGLDSLYAVTGGVSVFILTHHHSPLGPSGTGTRTLSTHNSRFIFTPLAFYSHIDCCLKGQRQMTETDSKSSYTVEKGNWETGHFPKVGLFTLYTQANAWTVERCLSRYSPGHWQGVSPKEWSCLWSPPCIRVHCPPCPHFLEGKKCQGTPVCGHFFQSLKSSFRTNLWASLNTEVNSYLMNCQLWKLNFHTNSVSP